jgi:hypothetical protein
LVTLRWFLLFFDHLVCFTPHNDSLRSRSQSGINGAPYGLPPHLFRFARLIYAARYERSNCQFFGEKLLFKLQWRQVAQRRMKALRIVKGFNVIKKQPLGMIAIERDLVVDASTEPATSAASAAIPGSTHSDPRTYSPTSSRRLLLPASPNIRSREWPVERIVQSRLIVSSPLCGGSLRGRWSHHMRKSRLSQLSASRLNAPTLFIPALGRIVFS